MLLKFYIIELLEPFSKFLVRMAIFTGPADTQPDPTLMGRVLPSPIKNRVGFGFFKKNPKRVQVLVKTWPNPGPDPTRLYPNY